MSEEVEGENLDIGLDNYEGMQDEGAPVQKQGVIQHIHSNRDELPDSISMGTDGKGGCLKVYFNANSSTAEIEERIRKAVEARKFMQKQMDYGIEPK